MLSKSSLEEKIGLHVTTDVYNSVVSTLGNYADLPKDLYQASHHPHIPIYAEIFSLTYKGCAAWSKLIQKKKTLNMINTEAKMAELFDIQVSEERWKIAYKRNRDIKYGNNIRWLNMQILRGALATNRFLFKAKIRNSDACSFCGAESETIEHLFWSCPTVNRFYNEAELNLATFNCSTEMNFCIGNKFFKEIMLLGECRENVPGEIPYLLDQLKRHVWICRCRGILPSWASFFNMLKREIKLDMNLLPKYPDMAWLGGLRFRTGIG